MQGKKYLNLDGINNTDPYISSVNKASLWYGYMYLVVEMVDMKALY